MNEEKYILAEFKRRLVEHYNKADQYSTRKDVLLEALVTIAAIEADAVLGKPEEQELPWAHLDDEKEDDR